MAIISNIIMVNADAASYSSFNLIDSEYYSSCWRTQNCNNRRWNQLLYHWVHQLSFQLFLKILHVLVNCSTTGELAGYISARNSLKLIAPSLFIFPTAKMVSISFELKLLPQALISSWVMFPSPSLSRIQKVVGHLKWYSHSL